jgi:hypothetical protein
MSFVSCAARRSAAAHPSASLGFALVQTPEDVPDGPAGTVAAALAAAGPPAAAAAAARAVIAILVTAAAIVAAAAVIMIVALSCPPSS